MKTKVIISIDTEFSIAGTFAEPDKYKPISEQAVYCKVDDRSFGLDFLLRTFAEFGVRATFLVEALNTHFFGDQPMGTIARQIRDAGHDVQMHLHPCWTYFKDGDWRTRLKISPPTDHMNRRSAAQLDEWIGEGIAAFRRWGLDAPVALRTGSLITDRQIYLAMERSGMTVASNIAVGVFRPEEPELRFYSGLHHVDSILEACVLTYHDPVTNRQRCLTITGSSWPETRMLLEAAHGAGIESVVVLTHPFEFVKYTAPTFADMRPSRVNQQRLRQLCTFLAAETERFEITTLSELATWTPKSERNVLLKASPSLVVGRMIQNFMNDHVKSF